MLLLSATLASILGTSLSGTTVTPPMNIKETTHIDAIPMCDSWAIAIHGGAGVIQRTTHPERRKAAIEVLDKALRIGSEMLKQGAPAIEVVEMVVRVMEDDPTFNAGRGSVFTENGTHELDASIMDGSTRSTGAVAGVRTVKNPITLARLVMTETPHVLLATDGAEAFADEVDVERVENTWFDTPYRKAVLERKLLEKNETNSSTESTPQGGSTVGCVVVDIHRNLAAATSTGGMTAKRLGRIGDSPIVGAGTWADSRVAVSGTGTGEEFIRWGVAQDIAAILEYQDVTLVEAAVSVVDTKLRAGDGGVICVGEDGSIAMVFNTVGMYRGAANAAGHFQIAIWDEPITTDN